MRDTSLRALKQSFSVWVRVCFLLICARDRDPDPATIPTVKMASVVETPLLNCDFSQFLSILCSSGCGLSGPYMHGKIH